MFNKKKFMTGAYSLGIAAVAVAAVILVNCLAAMLPSYITKPDVTPEKLATVGADSKKILEKVDTDITIYRIYSDSYVNASTGQAAAVDTNVKNLLDKYKDACSRITLKEVDPAKDPTFLDKYTKATLGQNSLVVESEKRSICVDINDMYRFEIVGYYDGEYLSAEEVNYAYQSIYENYYDMPEVKQYFFGENSITGAIDYVISDKIPVIYELTGHGEQPLSGYAFGKITVQENIELRELNLASGAAGTVPEDCEAVMIYTPTADLTKAESDALISYVDAGGVIMLYTFGELVSAEKMPNLAALTSHMGLEAIPGFICDNDAVSVVIPGMAEEKEIVQNLAAVSDTAPLSYEERCAINDIRSSLGTNFCRRCNYCQPCAAGINISGVFLFEGYLSRYGLGEWAKSRYATLPVKASACIGCGACEDRCPYNLPIRKMLKSAAEKFGE